MKTKIILFLLFILLIAGVVVTSKVNIDGLIFSRNSTEGVIEMTSDIEGVTNQLGLEDWVRVYNNTGSQIDDGTAVAFNGTHTDFTPLIIKASAVSGRLAIGFFGLTTSDIGDGEYGFITERGLVRDIPTNTLTVGLPVYLSSTSGELTSTKPIYPNLVILIGGCQKSHATEGVIFVEPSLGLLRQLLVKNYSFTSNGILAGTFYKAGFYDFSTTDANLTQASTTVAFGTSTIDYEAHAFIVCGGVGSVDVGVVGLRTTGTSISDNGSQVASSIDTILTDITSVALNEYYEAEKYIGTVEYELFVMSGTPTTYSLDFNYGYAKYEDFGNRDFYLAEIECLWQGGATDATGFDIELLLHDATGWTYHATTFEAGGTVIESRANDHVGFLGVLNGVDGAWKRSDLTTFVHGNNSSGVVIRITTGANGTIQTSDIHLGVALD